MEQKIIFSLIVLAIAAFIGCSGNNVQLRGKVTYSDDGTPLDTGTVCFVKDNSMSRGHINSDGTYVLITAKPGDGIPPGTYSVYVIGAERTKRIGRDDDFTETTVQLIDTKYSLPETSGLTCVVDRTTKTFDFQVDRPGSNKPAQR
jgi:hypothetical protein